MVEPTETDPDAVAAFVAAVPDARRRADAETLVRLMREATGAEPVLWGSIIGFGSYHYRYATGREGDMPAIGFAPRKGASTLYLLGTLDGYADLLGRLGPHTTGASCVYVKRVADVDEGVLRDIAARSFRAAA